MQCTHLLDLPEELLEWIAEFLTSSSPALLHLRSTCRRLRASSERVVAVTYFSDRTFLIYDKASLQTLKEISNHTIFAKTLQHVRFSLARIPISLRRRYRIRNLTRRRLQGQLRQLSKPLLNAQRRFEQRNGPLKYLRDILRNFKDAANIPALVATGEAVSSSDELHGYSASVCGYKRICNVLGAICEELGRDVLRVESDSAFSFIYQAIRDTKYPVKSLQLGCESYGVPLRTFELHEGDKSYANLRALRLTIELERGEEEHLERRHERPSALASNFVFFLVQAKSIELLSLSVQNNLSSSFPDIIFESVALAITFPPKPKARGLRKLRVLELERLRVDTSRLLDFVEACRGTLKRLSMRDIIEFRPPDIESKIRDAHGGNDLELDIDYLLDEEDSYNIV